ncbi:MAG: ArsC/Spx/MgsR family protein [Flavobacteriaceae bacterium]|jgi:arsenate reductase|nr:ArsC/Spx/MgsR family protein [Flavobacteriaceae bacterium]
MNYKIYHNPRCGKSREGLAILSAFTDKFDIIDYLKNPPTVDEITVLLHQLSLEPIDLVRQNESIWKDLNKGKLLNKQEIMVALVTHPKLIQRPIIIKNNKAIIGRPSERITDFLKS